MIKRDYLYAVAAFVLIPVVMILSAAVVNLINPEWAAGLANYERNYRLISLAKNFLLLAAVLLTGALWVLTCFYLLRSRARSYGWLALAALGPLVFSFLTMLDDRAPDDDDFYARFRGQLNFVLRLVYEFWLFVIVWLAAFQSMELISGLVIRIEAMKTGMSVAQIVELRNASSGMWAFSEGLETLYLGVLFYLLWPLCFNLAGRLIRRWRAAGEA